jgi:hypothetical protein
MRMLGISWNLSSISMACRTSSAGVGFPAFGSVPRLGERWRVETTQAIADATQYLERVVTTLLQLKYLGSAAIAGLTSQDTKTRCRSVWKSQLESASGYRGNSSSPADTGVEERRRCVVGDSPAEAIALKSIRSRLPEASKKSGHVFRAPKKSSIAVQSPRLSFEMSPSTRTSKGLLVVGTGVAKST